MKQLLAFTISIFLSVFCIMPTQAQASSWITTEDEFAGFYDLNSDNTTNIFDLIICKKQILEDRLGVRDLLNLQKYLLGESEINVEFFEEDMVVCSEENDKKYADIFTGYLTQFKYESGEIRLRFLKDCTVWELRCDQFGNGDILAIAEKNGENICGIVKDDEKYAISYSYLWNNAVASENTSFNDEDILWVSESENSTTFYLKGTDILNYVKFEKTSHLTSFSKIINYNTRMFIIGKNDDIPSIYSGTFSYWNFDNLTNYTDCNDYETFKKNNPKIINGLDGEILQYDTVETMALYLEEKEGLQIIKINPRKIMKTKFVVKTWEKDNEQYVLGISDDNQFVWDTSSTFSVG